MIIGAYSAVTGWYASTGEAYHPGTAEYAPMIMVRLAQGREGAEARWADGIHIARRRWEVFPMTCLRAPGHRLPTEAADARGLWNGAARPGVAAAPRSTA